MEFCRRNVLGALAASCVGALGPRGYAHSLIDNVGAAPSLLTRALAASELHRARIAENDVIGIVDFSAHSASLRLQLIEPATGRVIDSHLVAHGRGSDPLHSGWVQHFSNRPGSNASSEGAFVTAELYHGQHGRSRRLDGLDPANSAARDRGLVIHAAAYVDPALVASQGRIGRSEGCFALSFGALDPVLERLGPGRLLYAAK